MPVPLPVKTRAKLHSTRQVAAFEVSSVFIGAVAVSLASFVYWAGHDRSGAALILLSAAGILSLLMHGVSSASSD